MGGGEDGTKEKRGTSGYRKKEGSSKEGVGGHYGERGRRMGSVGGADD